MLHKFLTAKYLWEYVFLGFFNWYFEEVNDIGKYLCKIVTENWGYHKFRDKSNKATNAAAFQWTVLLRKLVNLGLVLLHICMAKNTSHFLVMHIYITNPSISLVVQGKTIKIAPGKEEFSDQILNFNLPVVAKWTTAIF